MRGQSSGDTDQLGLTEEDREKLAELADSDARTFNLNTGNGGRPSERIEKTCEHCEDVFEVPPSNSDRRFCSRDCSSDAGALGRPSERIEKTCEHCEDVFEVIPSNSDRRFCSSFCSHSEGKGGRPSLQTDGGRNSRFVEPVTDRPDGGDSK